MFHFRAVVLVLAAFALPSAAQRPAELVGTYDGGQPEIAAGLELRPDGRFRYGLSYGALDEHAEGSWRVEGGAVLLTSDPVTPPRFALVGRRDLPPRRFRILLDLPTGMSRQYFEATFRFADGATAERQLTEDQEPFALKAGPSPTQLVLALPTFNIRSAPVPLAGSGGQEIHFRFDPNDLGTVEFAATPLRIERGVLILSRHDRTLRFQPQRGSGD